MANGMNGNSKTPMEQIAELKKVLGETRKELEKVQAERNELVQALRPFIDGVDRAMMFDSSGRVVSRVSMGAYDIAVFRFSAANTKE